MRIKGSSESSVCYFGGKSPDGSLLIAVLLVPEVLWFLCSLGWLLFPSAYCFNLLLLSELAAHSICLNKYIVRFG